MKDFYFSVGPSQIHPSVAAHSKAFYEAGLGSISHRTAAFRAIYKDTVTELRTLMNIPEHFGIFFLSSASEIFERILLNTVEDQSFHLVNGSFAVKFYNYAVALKKNPLKLEKEYGEGFEIGEINVPESAELIAITQNETSTGVAIPMETIAAIKDKYPQKLVAVDVVSSTPFPQLDFSKIDMAFFSVQKAFGLPAGLGVWIVHPGCLDKAIRLSQKQSVGAHNTLEDMFKNYQNFETPSTPNVYDIYLLGKIAAEFNKTGVDEIRRTTIEKADLLYSFLKSNDSFVPFVKEEKLCSQTVIVADCVKGSSVDVIKALKEKGLVVSSGYGKFKERHLRIANFPAVPKERMVELIGALEGIAG